MGRTGRCSSYAGQPSRSFAHASRQIRLPAGILVPCSSLSSLHCRGMGAATLQRWLPEWLVGSLSGGAAGTQIQLRDWFPRGNVSMMVVKRPSLLLDTEFCHIPLAAGKLQVAPPCLLPASYQPTCLRYAAPLHKGAVGCSCCLGDALAALASASACCGSALAVRSSVSRPTALGL
jgi:hypothetical protein